MAERVLIVDDDPVQRRLLQNVVEKAGYQVATAESGEAALALITAPDGPHFECIVLDLVMPDLDGLGVLGRMREVGIAIPVIVQTAHGGIDVVVSAMRAGAVDFTVKPVGAERLLVSLRNALATRALEGELARMKRSRGGILSFKDIITRSAKMRAVLQAYDNDDAVREQVNRYIHDFEAMLRQVLSARDGQALGVTLLSSDMGKLYVALAQAIERLRS